MGKSVYTIKIEEENNRQSKIKQKEIKDIDYLDYKDLQLKTIKRSKRKPKVGDIFLLSPKENIFFYGKVFDVRHDSAFGTGIYMVIIFQNNTNKIDINQYDPNYDKLLTPPLQLVGSYWKQGFFYTIANSELTDYEKNLDIGFCHSEIDQSWSFRNFHGNEINHEPKLLGLYAVGVLGLVEMKIRRQLIINPEYFEVNSEKSSNSKNDINKIKYDDEDDFDVEEETNTLVNLYLNLKALPIDRGELEDLIEEKMEELDLGSVDGGGTGLAENGEIDYCDINLEMDEISDASIDSLKKILDKIDLPKGSFIITEDRKIPIGKLEGISLEIEINKIKEKFEEEYFYKEISKVMKRSGKLYGSYESDELTRFYYYGKDYDKMLSKLETKLEEMDIYEFCKIKKIA